MPGSQRISGEAFAVERLRTDPNLDYATLRREAAEAGVAIQPIQYGRARKQLGLPPVQKQAPAAVPARSEPETASAEPESDESPG